MTILLNPDFQREVLFAIVTGGGVCALVAAFDYLGNLLMGEPE